MRILAGLFDSEFIVKQNMLGQNKYEITDQKGC